MARYIDADNFRKTMIKRFGCIPCLTDYSEASRYDIPVDDALDLVPTADVVPKSEVVNEITSHLAGLYDFFKQNDDIREAYAILFAIAELRKKYTEETTDERAGD